MNVLTIGSDFVDNYIVKKSNVDNICRVRGVSIFSLSSNRIELNDIKGKSYKEKMLWIDLSKNVFLYAKEDAEYCVLDFKESYMSFCEISYGGAVVRVTEELFDLKEKTLNDLYGLNKKKVVNPLEWNKESLVLEIRKIANYIKQYGKKVVLYGYREPYHSINNNSIVIRDSLKKIVELNNFYEKCESMFIDEFNVEDIIFVPYLELNLGNDDYVSKTIDDYIDESLGLIENGNYQCRKKSLYDDYNARLQERIDELLLKTINFELLNNSKKPVFVVSDGYGKITSLIEQQINRNVEATLVYDEIDNSSFNVLDDYKEGCFFVIPHLSDNNLLKVIRNKYISMLDTIVVPEVPVMNLKGFVGKYSDIFHNEVCSECKVDVTLYGMGARLIRKNTSHLVNDICIEMGSQSSVRIMEDCMFDKTHICVGDGASINIEDSCTFADYCDIKVGNMDSVSYGKDCMTSSKVKIKTANNDDDISHKIDIMNHVWVGYQSVINADTSIGMSSIVGARANVCGDFSNNCIIVGDPAIMKKKDVTWARDPFMLNCIGNLDSCYLKETED